MPSLQFLVKELWRGKTLVRAILNNRLREEKLTGVVLDLGSGGTTEYTAIMSHGADIELLHFDQKNGQNTDFEYDALPYSDNSFDAILFLNVLEHIYNHQHILKEINRIKSSEGLLVGFVPFLKWYHADPHDYFRYTHEALEKLFFDTGYENTEIEALYIGPYSSAFDMILPTLPQRLRPFLYIACYMLDSVFRRMRPMGAKRYVLGYYFRVK